jgi:hypothetical protein
MATKRSKKKPAKEAQHTGSGPRATSAGAASAKRPPQTLEESQAAPRGAARPLENAPQFVAGSDAPADALRAHADDLSSDDELPKNTVGAIPMKWYAEYDHIGYTTDGKKISRRTGRDGMDRFLASQDDPHYKWTIYDEENDEEVVLSKRDVQLVQRIHSGTFAHPEFDPYPDAIEVFSDKVEQFALNADDEPKRRFVPSKWEVRAPPVLLYLEGRERAEHSTACSLYRRPSSAPADDEGASACKGDQGREVPAAAYQRDRQAFSLRPVGRRRPCRGLRPSQEGPAPHRCPQAAAPGPRRLLQPASRVPLH